jgi:fructokinase
MEPCSSSGLRIGVDVGGTKIEAVALAADGTERWRRRVVTPAGDYDATVRTIADLVAGCRGALGAAPCTIGVGTPGTVASDGRMKNCNSTCLNSRPLPADLERALGQPVRIANDANCLALSEATDGAGAGADVVFAAILGTGIGGGIAVHGRVLTGPNGLSGEWGHNPLPWAEADELQSDCYCGQRGCIETLLSGPAMAKEHALQHGGSRDAEAIAAGAAAGDAACSESMARYESRLARALAQVINLLDPDVVVLGGGLSRIERLYRNVPAQWGAWVFAAGSADAVRTRLVASRHGDSSGVRGAAWLWRDDRSA